MLTCGGMYSGRVELASSLGNWHAEMPSPGVAAIIGFAAQTKLLWVESALHTLHINFNPGDATVTQGIGV